MLKGKQAYQYDARNWNFYVCKIVKFPGTNVTLGGIPFLVQETKKKLEITNANGSNDSSSKNT